MTKKELRKSLLIKRAELEDVSDLLVDDLVESELLKDKKIIGLYYPLPYEINVLKLMDIYNVSFCFPKVIDNEMKFYLIDSIADFQKGCFNVYEPTSCNIIESSQIDAFVIPCVGITSDNKRIGYGKGYYDRYLEKYTGLKIALNYKECSNLDFEANDYDIKIDKVFMR